MSSIESFVLALLILFSAYMAAAEVALFSLSRFQIRSFRERARTHHKKIKKLLSDPGGLLITILVVNEILNIAISTMITHGVSKSMDTLLSRNSSPTWAIHALVGTLISAPILLFVCDVTPKTIGARANQLIAPLTVNSISLIYDFCKPIRVALQSVIQLVSRWSGQSERSVDDYETIKESDFLLMVEEGHKEGTIHASEVELIRNVFDLDDTIVADVFTPISQVRTLPLNTPIKDALTAIRLNRYSRVPVTGENKKAVVGILYSKDLLRAKTEAEQQSVPISEVMLDPIFVAPTMKLNALFRRFKQQKIHMAIVQKNPGEVLGIITMSDVLDTLFDDLFPEDEE